MSKGVTIILWIVTLAAGLFLGKTFLSEAPPPQVPVNDMFAEAGSGEGRNIEQISSGEVIEVRNGESIQDAVGKISDGGLIRVYPGTYSETIYIDKDNISVQGVISQGEWPVLDGKKELNDGFLYSGNGILIENFIIKNFKGNGIMGQAGNNFVLRNNRVHDAGVYGIFPEFGKNGLVEHNILSGIEDAAIYVGMCDNIDVRHNEVYESVAGIEIENSRHCLVEANYCHDNTGGILAFITPGLPIKTCYDVIIRNNFVVNNNHENFGAEGSIVSYIPAGTGILIMAADDVVIENNIITGNDNTGITIADLKFITRLSKDPDSEPYPDRLSILDNVMYDNGRNPIGDLATLVKVQMTDNAPDIVSIAGGTGGCIRNPDRYTTYGLDNYGTCELSDTRSITTFLLDKPVEPREVPKEELGEMAYSAVCAGCHAYSIRMIGPQVDAIQAMYKDNPQGIVDYITNPEKKRPDFPEMPPQDYLSEETRMAVAEYMLSIKPPKKKKKKKEEEQAQASEG